MRKILFVEPDKFMRDLYGKLFMLDKVEYIGWEKWSGDSINQIDQLKPNLICTNVLFPSGWDGYDAAKYLKSDARTQNIPIVFVTNLGQAEDIVEGFQFGAKDYIVVDNSIPSEVVRRCLNLL